MTNLVVLPVVDSGTVCFHKFSLELNDILFVLIRL